MTACYSRSYRQLLAVWVFTILQFGFRLFVAGWMTVSTSEAAHALSAGRYRCIRPYGDDAAPIHTVALDVTLLSVQGKQNTLDILRSFLFILQILSVMIHMLRLVVGMSEWRILLWKIVIVIYCILDKIMWNCLLEVWIIFYFSFGCNFSWREFRIYKMDQFYTE